MTIFEQYKDVLSWIESQLSFGRTGYDWERRDQWSKFKKDVKALQDFMDELDRRGIIKWDGDGWLIPSSGAKSP